jgi:hypothetical protein
MRIHHFTFVSPDYHKYRISAKNTTAAGARHHRNFSGKTFSVLIQYIGASEVEIMNLQGSSGVYKVSIHKDES